MIENHSTPHRLDEVIRWLTQQSRRAESSSHGTCSKRTHCNEGAGPLPRLDRQAARQQAMTN
jgi:hypothetical protein